MKLLAKPVAQSQIKRENDELIETNIRLRELWQQITTKFNTARDTYEPDKLKALRDFEAFTKDITLRKSKLLEELHAIEKQIEARKEVYYGIIAKQDALDERMYQLEEETKKLELRKVFVEDLEEKWRNKQ